MKERFFENITLTVVRTAALSEAVVAIKDPGFGRVAHISLVSILKGWCHLTLFLPHVEGPICLAASIRFILAWASLYLPGKKETKVYLWLKVVSNVHFSLRYMYVLLYVKGHFSSKCWQLANISNAALFVQTNIHACISGNKRIRKLGTVNNGPQSSTVFSEFKPLYIYNISFFKFYCMFMIIKDILSTLYYYDFLGIKPLRKKMIHAFLILRF